MQANASAAWHPTDMLKAPRMLLSLADRFVESEMPLSASVDAVNSTIPVAVRAMASLQSLFGNAFQADGAPNNTPAEDGFDKAFQADGAPDMMPVQDADQPQPANAPDPPPDRVGVSTETRVKRRGKYDTWQHLKRAQRAAWDPSLTGWLTPKELLISTGFRQWFLFWFLIPCCVVLSRRLSEWSVLTGRHFTVLFIWLLIAAMFNSVVFVSLGTDMAAEWLTGYLLEVMFSVENVFAFHSIAQAFELSKRATQNAMLAVVLAQIAFQFVMYMGVAHYVRSMGWLPYFLGTWLIFLGVEAGREDGESTESFDIKSSTPYKALLWILGDRILPEEGDRLACSTPDGYRITLTGMLAMCLIVADFLLCIDVSLTKIQELDNAFMAFSSSAFASFLVPEFVVMAQELFDKYSLLKYAMSFILIFFGLQMLAVELSLFCLPDLLGCAIIFVVLAVAVALSPQSQASTKELQET